MEKIELKAHKPKPNRMTSIEENVQLARIQQASSVSTSAIYERKPNQKALKVLTVAAYILFVSMAAITLSFYYVFIWDPAATIPKPPLLTSPAPGTNGKGAVICDTKIIIPENVAVRLANSTKVTAEKFYKYIYQNYRHSGANGRARADGVDVIDTIAATDEPIADDDADHRRRDPYEAEPRSADGIIASRIGPPDEPPPLPVARAKGRLATTATTTDLPAADASTTSTSLDVPQYADDEFKSPTLLASASPQIVAEARWGYDDTDDGDGDADDVRDRINADAAESKRRGSWKFNQRKQRRTQRKQQQPMVDVDAEDAGDDDDDDDRDADGDDFEASGGVLRGDRRARLLSVGRRNDTVEANEVPLAGDRGENADGGDADGSDAANGL